ncbi:MAG: molybdopterin dinucleotide binding domain-containing protein, partial [Pseudomonadota bacterium]
STAWALTRQDHGEQPFWAAIALATLLGQIGQPGTGIGFGYSAMNYMGGARIRAPFAALPQGENPIRDFIPVARIAEMLEAPGAQYRYDGETRAYPDARLVWWAGGNPFHHHQDLNRLRRAWRRPETVIAPEWCLNSLARHADIVLPVTTTLERRDLALTPKDAYAVVMDKVVQPVGAALSDHAIFRALAAEMGVEHAFTEGRSEEEWLAHLYSASKSRCAARGIALPSWEDFNLQGWFKLPEPDTPTIFLENFVKDPGRHRLRTPSGKIELFSETVAAFGDADCPGHPFWMPPAEWLGAASGDELHLLSNQPANKLHSQLDHGRVSARDKVGGRDVARLHPAEAARRGLADGDTIRLFNARGACHAALRLSEDVMEGVIQMATGAWFAPDGETCLHGNPNVLTRDAGTSSLAQGPSANSCLVRVEKAEDLPDFVLQPPVIQPRERES